MFHRLRKCVTTEKMDKILNSVIQQAIDGSWQASKLIMDRCLPKDHELAGGAGNITITFNLDDRGTEPVIRPIMPEEGRNGNTGQSGGSGGVIELEVVRQDENDLDKAMKDDVQGG